MADLKANRKRLTINLSLFAPNDHKWTTKSPKSFEPTNGVVGLGIVAAMNELDHQFVSAKSSRSAILAVSPRSTPIPILINPNSKFGAPSSEDEDMEGYTCVISHIGNNLIKKREYFDGVLANESESIASNWVSVSSPSVQSHRDEAAVAEFRTADFLSSCNLCKKQLHGLDIFMYRGEKAFCSAECRRKQILMDEHKEKCGSMKPLGFSVSPCSSPMQFLAGVAAA